MALLLLALSVFGLLFTYNAFRPRYAPAGVAVLSFFAGWLTAELALHHVLWQGLVVAALVWSGALAAWSGKLGLALNLVSWWFLWRCWWRGHASRVAVATALEQGLPAGAQDLLVPFSAEPPAALGTWRQLLLPIPVTHPAVERLRNVAYFDQGGLRLRLDVFRRKGGTRAPGGRRPALVFVHGGGWVIGNKEYQGLPMLHHLAASGWVCFSINYRLSPRATFPDHIIDVKRAIAWVRAHAAEFGVDPGFLVVSGNSAGAHLAALAALTANRPEFQPGFTDADTSVAACVSFYGIYDLTDRHGHWPHPGVLQLLERWVMKARLSDAPEAFAAASPIHYVDDRAPPFLIVHGDRDSVITVAEGRAFFAALRAVSPAPCVYFEIPGAQHAFEVFPSPRTLHVLRGVDRFLGYVHRRHAHRASH